MEREEGGVQLQPGGAANTFNNIERVYSRAIAFSNRRCSVPLESNPGGGGGMIRGRQISVSGVLNFILADFCEGAHK